MRAFALGMSGKAKPREFRAEFVRGLMGCFGWDEVPGQLEHVIDLGGGESHKTGLWWPERKVLIEVREPYVMLTMAWPDTLKALLGLDPLPRYVLFTNRREIQLYDTKRGRDEPLLNIEMEELPKYSEALAFLRRDWTPADGLAPIVDVSAVSKQVADRVGALYRSLVAGGADRDESVRYVLQCITSMFAEDIGLLPKDAFTQRLYDAGGDPERAQSNLAELFTLMATPMKGPRAVRYFNGGLFNDSVSLPLDDRQLRALTKAAEANWTEVDPHIFGSVFQSIMSDEERHATGAHYTAREDIMLVVGPTIVEPWRKKIQSAKTLTELRALRDELGTYRVLDPACGSGNFLYVAYRELYRLETELLMRMRNEFASTHESVDWRTVIRTTNFHGIDINPFAVELARTTLNIAKKIAFEERRETMLDFKEQVEMVSDPSLPLDNLSEQVVCADALFTDWPEVEAIVGNPPFLGGQRMRGELGGGYIDKLKSKFNFGVVDLCAYWIRLGHGAVVKGGGVGFICTSAVRFGRLRDVSLSYIVNNDGVIVYAVSSKDWSGDSNVDISVVNWVVSRERKGIATLVVKGVGFEVDEIGANLMVGVDANCAVGLVCNSSGTSMGVIFGHRAFEGGLGEIGLADLRISSEYLKRSISGGDILRIQDWSGSDFCIYMASLHSEEEAEREAFDLYRALKSNFYPEICAKVNGGKGGYRDSWIHRWWQPVAPRSEFYDSEVGVKKRILVAPRTSKRSSFVFISSDVIPNNSIQIFSFDDDYSFGVIHSGYHWAWVRALGSQVKKDAHYTTKVWKTFPWPQCPTEDQVVRIAQAGRELRALRRRLMAENDWNLRQLYQSAEKVGEAHPLTQAQAAIDAAVKDAYGHPGDQGIVEFLLELNGFVAEDEKAGLEVQGPGLPRGFEKDDPRWMSDDCIMPPPFPGSAEAAE